MGILDIIVEVRTSKIVIDIEKEVVVVGENKQAVGPMKVKATEVLVAVVDIRSEGDLNKTTTGVVVGEEIAKSLS